MPRKVRVLQSQAMGSSGLRSWWPKAHFERWPENKTKKII